MELIVVGAFAGAAIFDLMNTVATVATIATAPKHEVGRSPSEEEREWMQREAALRVEEARQEERKRQMREIEERQREELDRQRKEAARLALAAQERARWEQVRKEMEARQERERQEREAREKKMQEEFEEETARQVAAAKEQALAEDSERRRREREEYPMPAFLQVKRQVNWAVTGDSGQGKSAFVNLLLGKKVAEVGVKETTMEPTSHSSGGEVPLVLWDLPGAGTEKFPTESYIQKMGLRYFDVVIIVTAGRLRQQDHRIMQELRKHKVPHFVVRSKFDMDIENERNDNGKKASETRDAVRAEFKEQGVEQVYLITTKEAKTKRFFFLKNNNYDNDRLKADMASAVREVRAVDESESETDGVTTPEGADNSETEAEDVTAHGDSTTARALTAIIAAACNSSSGRGPEHEPGKGPSEEKRKMEEEAARKMEKEREEQRRRAEFSEQGLEQENSDPYDNEKFGADIVAAMSKVRGNPPGSVSSMAMAAADSTPRMALGSPCKPATPPPQTRAFFSPPQRLPTPQPVALLPPLGRLARRMRR